MSSTIHSVTAQLLGPYRDPVGVQAGVPPEAVAGEECRVDLSS